MAASCENDERITVSELRDMFGSSIPIAAARILVDPTLTPKDARRLLARIASYGRAFSIARECVAALSDGWGAEEEERAAAEIEPIISKYLKD